MCESAVVLIHGEERWCDTIGELSRALNCRPANIPVSPGLVPAWNHCLCHVDFPALAKRRGMECVKRGWDDKYMGEWQLTAPTPPHSTP